jgi:hypothetical protein
MESERRPDESERGLSPSGAEQEQDANLIAEGFDPGVARMILSQGVDALSDEDARTVFSQVAAATAELNGQLKQAEARAKEAEASGDREVWNAALGEANQLRSRYRDQVRAETSTSLSALRIAKGEREA